jgi:hypothetical protein
MNHKNIATFFLVSSVLTIISVNTNSASAASLGASCLSNSENNPGEASGDYLFAQGDNKQEFKANCNVTDIGKVEGRAGASGTIGDYEVGIGLNGAQANVADRLQLLWIDEAVYNWTLNWNTTTNVATFTVGSNSINYDFDLSASPTLSLDKFNSFGIQARADDPSSYITENTALFLTVDSMTMSPVNPLAPTASVTIEPDLSLSAISSLSSPNIISEFYTLNVLGSGLNSLNSEITSMSGTFSMDIPNGGVNPQAKSARSRIGFEVLLFDPPVDNTEVPSTNSPINREATPEPGTVFSLFALGALGWSSMKKRSYKNL